jgi:ADP-heptose:LPS heptosyltransferase
MSSYFLILLDTLIGFFLVPIGLAVHFSLRFFLSYFKINPRKVLIIKLLGAGNFLAMNSPIKNYSADIVTVKSNVNSLEYFNIGSRLYIIDDRNFLFLVLSSVKILFVLLFKNYKHVINLEMESRFAKFVALIVSAERVSGLSSHNKSYLDKIIYDQYLVSPLLASREEIIEQLVEFRPKQNFYLNSLLQTNKVRLLKEMKRLNHIGHVSIFPSCSSTDKHRRLKFDDWKEVILRLLDNKKISNISIIFPSIRDEQFLLFRQFLAAHHNSKINLNVTNFNEFAHIIEQSDLVVSVDSQALHIAQLYKKKTVAFYGPTSPFGVNLENNTYPITNSLVCSPCTHKYLKLPCAGKAPCLNFKHSDFSIFNA